MSAEHDNSVWTENFTEKNRDQQLADDSEAWHAVTGLLLAIVTFGVCLALFTVTIISF